MTYINTANMNHRRVLVVEDEPLIAMLVRDLLADVGFRSMTAFNLIDALVLAKREQFDCALLDVSIGDETVFEVADALARRNIPLVFTSGHSAEILPDRYRGHALLAKPYMPSELARIISSELQDHSTRSSEARDETPDATEHDAEKTIIKHANSN
jgi:DNA-binding response OmpR family regulator